MLVSLPAGEYCHLFLEITVHFLRCEAIAELDVLIDDGNIILTPFFVNPSVDVALVRWLESSLDYNSGSGVDSSTFISSCWGWDSGHFNPQITRRWS